MCFTPNGVQVCVIAVLIEEWRNGVLIATSIREMQVVVYNCNNQQPVDASPGVVNVVGGGTVKCKWTIRFGDLSWRQCLL